MSPPRTARLWLPDGHALGYQPIAPLGADTADRAAALPGVPRSTIHWWARERILVPSVSATSQKSWSFTDLMGLRTIYWHAGAR